MNGNHIVMGINVNENMKDVCQLMGLAVPAKNVDNLMMIVYVSIS